MFDLSQSGNSFSPLWEVLPPKYSDPGMGLGEAGEPALPTSSQVRPMLLSTEVFD